MSSPSEPEDPKSAQDATTAPSAEDVTNPTLQAEIANPADSNEPSGAEAIDEPAAADEGSIEAPGAPGELHSDDETGVEGVQGEDAVEPAAGASSTGTGDETGVEGIQGEDAVEPADAPAVDQEATSPTTPEQPAATEALGAPPAGAAGSGQPASTPNEAAAAPDDAAAEATPVAPEERAGDDTPPPEEPAQAELDEARAELLAALQAALGDEAIVAHWARERGDLWVRVRPQDWRGAAEAARSLGFTYFCFLSAIDWLPSPFGKSEDGEPRTIDEVRERIEALGELDHGVTGGETRFQLLARVFSVAKRLGLILKADLPEDGPVVETWTGVYPGANWHEREAHEMFGIGFAGHPYLANLYLPGAFEGHPLRKDFPLLAREVKPWPGLVDVEAMPGEPEPPTDDAPETSDSTAASA